jgi:hypothetical protein
MITRPWGEIDIPAPAAAVGYAEGEGRRGKGVAWEVAVEEDDEREEG